MRACVLSSESFISLHPLLVTPPSCVQMLLGDAAKLPLPLLPLDRKPEKPPNALGGCSETFISFPQAALNSWTPRPKSRSD